MFSDVKPGQWFYNLIERLFRMGAAHGYPDGTFQPDKDVTRAECAAMIDKYHQRKWALLKEIVPCVVKVTADLGGKTSLGSGVVLDQEGYIATNIHVVAEGIDLSSNVKVYLDSIPTAGIKAEVIYGEFTQDIAILKISAEPDLLTPVTFATQVRLLDEVFCVGNPLGYGNTVTQGIISFERRVLGGEWIQTDCSINPGNSGGGAFNAMGEFIGLPTFKMLWADPDKTIPVDNMGFITPHDKVLAVYNKAKSGKVAFEGSPSKDFVLFT